MQLVVAKGILLLLARSSCEPGWMRQDFGRGLYSGNQHYPLFFFFLRGTQTATEIQRGSNGAGTEEPGVTYRQWPNAGGCSPPEVLVLKAHRDLKGGRH